MTRKRFSAFFAICAGCLSSLPAQVWEQIRWLPEEGAGKAAFDSSRNRLVFVRDNATSAIWEWDAAGWTRVPVNLDVNEAFAMAYDPNRQKTILQGGLRGTGGSDNDTYEYDGVSLTNFDVQGGPLFRYGHAMVHDPISSRTFFFGGRFNSWRGDIWQYKGDGLWGQIAANGPFRGLHAMAFDLQRNRLVIFGGVRTNPLTPLLGDTWEWDGSNWIPHLLASGPAPRRNAIMVHDAARGDTLLIGGIGAGNTQLNDVWTWTGTTWASEPAAPFSFAHAVAYDDHGDRVLVVGKDGSADYSQVWERTNQGWQRIGPQPPRTRTGHGMAYDANRQRTVMFGGLPSGIPSNETWEWTDNGWQFRTLNGPSARLLHSMSYDSMNGVTVLFGGGTVTSSPLADTWTWDGNSWTQQSPTTTPPARWRAAMAYDSSRARTVLFGGSSDIIGNNLLGDTWEWDGSDWLLRSSSGPAPRFAHSMAYDSRRGRVVLYGGNTAATGDTWEWDGSSWTMVATVGNGPSGGFKGEMVYHDAIGKVVLRGGFNVVWLWDGSAWTVLNSQPIPFDQGAMVYDRSDNTLLMFGRWPFAMSGSSMTWRMRVETGFGRSYGTGCGTPALALGPTCSPRLGANGSMRIENIAAGPTFVVLGSNDHTFGAFSLPVSLIAFGMPGCDLLQAADGGSQLATPGANGTATWSLPIPNLPSLIGTAVYAQAWSVAPGANPAGMVISNGVEWIIR